MHSSQFCLLLAGSSVAAAWPSIWSSAKISARSDDSWTEAGETDARGPCPMLNALANHGLLPHDGKDISSDVLVNALGTALNVEQSLALYLFQQAITTNSDANATTFSLTDLNNHNILEHDASLSRGDYYFGDNHSFNETIFNETRSFWTDDTVDPLMAANSLTSRYLTSNTTNPNFTISTTLLSARLSESAAYISTLGNKTDGTVPKAYAEYLFENERLPTEIGWQRSNVSIALSDFLSVMALINSAATSSSTKLKTVRGHSGFHLGPADAM